MQGRIKLPQSINHPFDLARTLDGSQDFRWQSLGDSWHSGVLKGNLVHLRQNVDTLEYRAHTNLDVLLTSYFRLDEDMDTVYSILSSLDPYIATLAKAYPHLRLLHQPDPWECTVSYICSANNSVPRIKHMVEGIAQKLGRRLDLNGDIRYTFPLQRQCSKPAPNLCETCAWASTATTRSLRPLSVSAWASLTFSDSHNSTRPTLQRNASLCSAEA